MRVPRESGAKAPNALCVMRPQEKAANEEKTAHLICNEPARTVLRLFWLHTASRLDVVFRLAMQEA